MTCLCYVHLCLCFKAWIHAYVDSCWCVSMKHYLYQPLAEFLHVVLAACPLTLPAPQILRKSSPEVRFHSRAGVANRDLLNEGSPPIMSTFLPDPSKVRSVCNGFIFLFINSIIWTPNVDVGNMVVVVIIAKNYITAQCTF